MVKSGTSSWFCPPLLFNLKARKIRNLMRLFDPLFSTILGNFNQVKQFLHGPLQPNPRLKKLPLHFWDVFVKKCKGSNLKEAQKS